MEGSTDEADGRMTPRTELSQRESKSQLFILHIMTHLGEHSQKRIEQEIIRSGGVVDMVEFVNILKEELMQDFRNSDLGSEVFGGEEELVENLCELFKCIDINGDGTMEWSEFTSFVVEKAKTYDKQVDLGNTPPYVVVDSPKSKEGAAFRSYSYQGNVKVLMGTGLGETDYDASVRFVSYIKQLDALVTLRQKSSIVRIHDVMDSSEIGRFREAGCPISVEYIPSTALEVTTNQVLSNGISSAKVGCLAITNDNSTITVRDLSPGSQQFGSVSSMSTPHPQVSLSWNCRHRLLVSSSTAGLIHTWDLAAREERSCFYAHDDITSKVLCIEDLDMVISAGMDSLVCAWDLYSGAQQAEYFGHKGGVEYLAYNPTHQLIFSGGVDHDALVWSPFSPSLLYKLRGHHDCLIGIETFPNFPHQLLTADESGFFKVWDVRTFNCLQTFSCERTHVNAFALCPGNIQSRSNSLTMGGAIRTGDESLGYSPNYISRVVACTKTLTVIDQKNPIGKMITDDFPVVVALFNSEMLTILTASGRSVRVWDVLTGKLKSTFKDIATSDITAMCLDDRKRKFLLGTHDGSIRVYNCANGVEMKSMVSHDAEVSSLLYMGADKLVISTSWDKRIIVHSELEDGMGKIVREMDNLDFHTDDIVACDYSKSLGYIVTGSLDRFVCVWMFDLGKLHGRVQHSASITAVKFFGDRPIVVASDAEGALCFWQLRKAPLSYKCLHTYHCLTKVDDEGPAVESKEVTAAMIHSFDYCFKTQTLVVADEHGALRALKVEFDAEQETIETKEIWVHTRAHQDSILFTQIHFNGDWVISSGQDRCVKVFDTTTGHCLGVLIDGAGIGSNRSQFWNVPFDVQRIKDERQRSIDNLFARSKELARGKAQLVQEDNCETGQKTEDVESKAEPITPRSRRRNLIKTILQNT